MTASAPKAPHRAATDAAHDGAQPKRRVAVWDLPTRLFHWGLVAALGVAWWSGEEGDFTVHFIAGHVVVGLLVFRLLWGVIGSQTARFSDFVRGPGAVGRYLRRTFSKAPDDSIGHNPAGAVMVLLLLLMVGVQAGTGLFASENTWAFVSGPLAGLVDGATSSDLTSLHKGVLFNALLVLAGLHVLAAVVYLVVKRENLIGAMVVGRKWLPADKADPPPRMASRVLALAVALAAAGLAGWLYSLT
ncbi:cytochrome b/b6 domain-containing protein [Roseospira goensis]|uniref:Cytochrome b n=1 Tax=Roseospira goensis TaxID=391922 RepID=A0A7W6S0B4_9PROT|nr:cytochrome b/b6 domain-containing protein [Roseospira goensis]MBB4286376.1 cytochrome b [Roseospira goensis]